MNVSSVNSAIVPDGSLAAKDKNLLINSTPSAIDSLTSSNLTGISNLK